MHILITGASGYAGYYAALRLAAAGHHVTGLVRRPESPRLNTLRAHEITIATGDVGDPAGYRHLLEASDVVIHTMLDKRAPLASDRALFAALAGLPEHRGARRRFIYTTGCSIFGKIGVRVMDETAEPHPGHALGFRRVLEIEALALPMSVVVLRPGFMYGNDGFNSQSSDWFEMAERGDVVYRGDRVKGWSWIHVDDLAEAYRLVAEADCRVDGEVFCLADEQRPRCLDVMRAAVDAAHYTGEIRFAEPLAGDNASTWFDQNEFITSEKARRILRWVPRRHGVLDALPAAYAAWKAARSLT